jgi:hypothetical protein
MPDVQARVVRKDGADARQHRTSPFAPGVSVSPGLGAGDPLAGAVVQRGSPVQAEGQLQTYPRSTAFLSGKEADVQFARCPSQRALRHVDMQACGAQAFNAAAGDLRVRIFDGHHHARKTGSDQRVTTRRRPAMVRTGLERDPGGGAADVMPCGLRRTQGHDFGVRAARFLG